MKKRILSLLCSLALLVTMMPVSAFAADASWAQSAVSALNEIYGSGVFSADDGLMSNADVQSVLSKTGWKTDVLLDNNEFTRSDACEVLADVFMLPLGKQSAIQYLYDKNIVSGTANGDLNADGSVSFAEFSVLSYRVLNTVGGGKGSAISGLKPGTDEYYGWLYLAVRKCVPFSTERGNEKIGQAEGFETYGSSKLKDDYTDVYEVELDTVSRMAIWDAWEDALQDPQIGGDMGFSATSYDENDTLLQAAGKIVKQFVVPFEFGSLKVTDMFLVYLYYLFQNGSKYRKVVLRFGFLPHLRRNSKYPALPFYKILRQLSTLLHFLEYYFDLMRFDFFEFILIARKLTYDFINARVGNKIVHLQT